MYTIKGWVSENDKVRHNLNYLPFLGETPKMTLSRIMKMIVSENSQCSSHILRKKPMSLLIVVGEMMKVDLALTPPP